MTQAQVDKSKLGLKFKMRLKICLERPVILHLDLEDFKIRGFFIGKKES